MAHALVVEDDLLLNRIFNDMVADMGYAVTAADNPDAARRALRDHDYQIVVTDLDLCGDSEGGLTLADEIRRQGLRALIVIVSGHPKPARLRPEICFLQKPFTMAQLQGVLDQSAL